MIKVMLWVTFIVGVLFLFGADHKVEPSSFFYWHRLIVGGIFVLLGISGLWRKEQDE